MVRAEFLFLVLVVLAAVVEGKVFFKETFSDGEKYKDRWVVSNWKKSDGTAGDFKISSGEWFANKDINAGLKTSQDARFYAISSKFKYTSDKKKPLVVQFSAKNEQRIDCGGGYIKLIPSGLDQSTFSGDSKYSIMFGPDICGSSQKKIHVIFNYDGKNLEMKKSVDCPTDTLTHVYTLIVKPDQTYKVLVDGKEEAAGKLEDDWDFLKPKKIKDPKASKPDDWVDEAKIPDPSDEKPDGYDDIPAKIADPDAKVPEDWDEDSDGEWEAPMIDNPAYKGPWKPKMIENPDYKGKWVHPMIDNPDYKPDPNLHVFNDLEYVGFELWQVKAGTIFDNIIVADSIEEVKSLREDTFEALKDAEKKAFDKENAKKQAVAEAERKKLEEEKKKPEPEEEDEEEEEEEKEEL